MLVHEMKSRNYEAQLSREEIKILEKCNCYPSCADLRYSAETSEAPLHIRKAVAQSGMVDFSEEYNDQ